MLYIAPSIVLAARSGELNTPVFLWQNLVTVSGITADEEDADFPASNLANPQTSSLWKGETTADQEIVFDLNPTEPITAFGIARHNFGSTHCGVKVYGKTADPAAVFELLADLSPGDDSPILAIVDGDYYVQGKIALEPDATVPQMAVVYIGSLLTMPIGIPPGHMPLFDARDIGLLAGIAENGDFLGDVVTSQQLTTSVEFKVLDGDWYRANMRAFVQQRAPFFFAWSPGLYPLEVGYAKFNGNPKPAINQATGQVDIQLPLIGLAL